MSIWHAHEKWQNKINMTKFQSRNNIVVLSTQEAFQRFQKIFLSDIRKIIPSQVKL